MSTRRYQLTAELQTTICGYILSGGYPHVAAEAAGIPREVFDGWMRRARARAPTKKYRLFYEAIVQARGQVRLAAEAKALTKDPLAWLKCGPGKETPDAPGWTNPPRAQVDGDPEAVNLLMRRETQDLMATLLRILEPFPEVRTRVAEALAGLDTEPPPETRPPSTEPGERGA
jgi:hypothetical protein